MDQKATNSRNWPDIPTELKLDILRYHLTTDTALDAKKHGIFFRQNVLPLLRTRNNDLTNLALEIYYTSNTFVYSPNAISDRNDGLWEPKQPRFCRPSATIAQYIRHLEIRHISNDYYDHHEQWDYLLKSTGIESRQRLFPRLERLTVRIELGPRMTYCWLRESILELLRERKRELRTDTVKIIIEAVSSANSPCSGLPRSDLHINCEEKLIAAAECLAGNTSVLEAVDIPRFPRSMYKKDIPCTWAPTRPASRALGRERPVTGRSREEMIIDPLYLESEFW
ncbi:hypothetical protein BDV96DRAFT_607613 [Lophiotrema nucula]|uniref:Uncharacterized protein n=1 Tax=Lophiotrema nucula TaxID=690887 RepID=A0A6A5YG88_9PLEO|nr:hypothetical protein BDV96DRAFT_607613 [Lophiotrema nucula]